MGDLGMSKFKGAPFTARDTYVFDADNEQACHVYSRAGFNGDFDIARLFAAAPELLEALQEIWDSCCTNAASKPSKKALLMANAAIKKAIG